MKPITRQCLAMLAAAGLGCFSATSVNAQSTEAEPNDSCDTAQSEGSVVLPFLLLGTVEDRADPDVDFFRFSADPLAELIVEQKGESTNAGTLSDPYLGWFDSSCALQSASDDYRSLDSRLFLTVPANGIFILAASSCCDYDFNGSGGSRGSYALSIAAAPPRIGSISAQAMDALSGVSLVGDAPPYAHFELAECIDDDCSYFVSGEAADGDGRVIFVSDFSGEQLRVGTYQITAFANDYELSRSDPFYVGEGEKFDLGALFLDPPPISISNILSCDTLSSSGGTCRYRVQVNNNTSESVRGVAWSLVDGYNLGSDAYYTTFEATASPRQWDLVAVRRSFRAKAFEGSTVEFTFTVPASVNDGAEFCTRLFLGLHPDPLFNPVKDNFLFCVEKGSDGFSIMSKQASEKLNDSRGNGRHSPARR